MFLDHQMICGGSCDTEDWSNDDKFSFDHRNKLHFTGYSHRKLMIYIIIIFQSFSGLFCIFNQETLSKTLEILRSKSLERQCVCVCVCVCVQMRWMSNIRLCLKDKLQLTASLKHWNCENEKVQLYYRNKDQSNKLTKLWHHPLCGRGHHEYLDRILTGQ